jgi:hypothetical protein
MVCAWPEPPFASIAGVCDGMEALALVGAITETKSKLLRRGRIGRGEGERRSLYPSRPPRLERDQRGRFHRARCSRGKRKARYKVKNIRDHYWDSHRDPDLGVDVGAF